MKNKATQIEKLFSQVNCAQTVFSLHAEELGINENTALKISSGFGGGMACAETCGAVTGAYMVIGMKHGHTSGEPNAKANTKQKIQQFNAAFKAKHGSLICKNLVGHDISTPEGAQTASQEGVFGSKCPQFIKTACSIIEKNF